VVPSLCGLVGSSSTNFLIFCDGIRVVAFRVIRFALGLSKESEVFQRPRIETVVREMCPCSVYCPMNCILSFIKLSQQSFDYADPV